MCLQHKHPHFKFTRMKHLQYMFHEIPFREKFFRLCKITGKNLNKIEYHKINRYLNM